MKMFIILQETPMECGIACLAMIGAHFGKGTQLKDYRELFDSPLAYRQSFSDIRKAANKLSLDTVGVNIDRLDNISTWLPCIGQIILAEDCLHFVVIYSLGENITIADPARGIRLLPKKVFYNIFTGNTLLFYEKQ